MGAGAGACPIRVFPDPILRKPCAPVEPGGIAARMVIDALRASWSQGMLGLAAPQVGLSYQWVIILERHQRQRLLLNPRIVERSPTVVRGPEACLSLPFVMAEVTRAEWVVLEAIDPDVGDVKLLAHGAEAAVVQHELDHLNGVLFIDRLTKSERKEALREAERLSRSTGKGRIVLPGAQTLTPKPR